MTARDSVLHWSQEQYDRHVGALVLVFQREPCGDGAISAKIGLIRASMTLTGASDVVRIPAAIWIGHYDSCDFRVGDTRELIVALKGSFKFPCLAVEARRSASGMMPPHYHGLAVGEYTLAVRLFDTPNGQHEWNFKFNVKVNEDADPTISVR